MKQHQLAGFTLALTSLGFVAVFSYLATSFGYPDVLDGEARVVLPAFVAGGPTLRWVWAMYAALPIGVAVSAILAFPLFRQAGETRARFGLVAALVSAAAMSAGLARWPTLHHTLGQRFVRAGAEEQELLSTLFDAANLYLGNVAGEFIGELMLSTWFGTLASAIPRGIGMPRWLGYFGLFAAASLATGAFRNVTEAVRNVAELNDALLPIWLIVLGVALTRARPPLGGPSVEGPERLVHAAAE